MKISVIVPTRNEEANIAPIIGRLRMTSAGSGAEIIVVDAGSSDRTAEIARSLANKVIQSAHPGRASQMHEGALSASGDLLLFLHADTLLPDNWHEKLQEAWTSSHPPIATAFQLGFNSERPVFRFLAAAANWRTAWTRVPHGDQAIAVRKDDYFQAGGFPPAPLMEEYFLFKKLRSWGRVLILPGSVSTSTRRYEKNGPLLNGLRNVFIVALYYLGASPRFLARLYSRP